MYSFSLTSEGFLIYLFLSLLLIEMAFLRFFVIKGTWFPLTIFFLSGACFSTIKEKVFVKAEKFSLKTSVSKEKCGFFTFPMNFCLWNLLR